MAEMVGVLKVRMDAEAGAALEELARLERERDQALAENERLRSALWEIVHPVKAMLERVPKGHVIDGAMACRLAEMPSHLQQIARKALEKEN